MVRWCSSEAAAVVQMAEGRHVGPGWSADPAGGLAVAMATRRKCVGLGQPPAS